MSFGHFLSEITRKKHLLHVAAVKENSELRRTLTTTSLTSLGVGSVVGAGIFVITGQAAAVAAGPALAISFILSGISCFFSGICYAELAAAIPISGSAYSFTYVAVGEFAAWMVAICLTLEYLIATAAVSVGWSGSVQNFMREFGLELPKVFSAAPLEIEQNGSIGFSGTLVNLPAVLINIMITIVLTMGVKESANFNNFFVAVKLTVLVIFCGFGLYYASTNTEAFTDNLTPFVPPNDGTFGKFGISGIFRGAGMVFFSYVGFDSVCAMAQECKNPTRDLPRGLLFTLAICTVLYVCVTVCLTGMANYTQLNVDDPVSHALRLVKAPALVRYMVDIGAISGLTSVCLVSLMCMPRLIYTLSHDGLLPKVFGKVHEKFRTPVVATIVCGMSSMTVGGLLPLDVLGELVSAGTLMAFMLVCYSVIAFRDRHPEYPRPFMVPFVPYFPMVGIGLCIIQMTSLPVRTLVYYVLLQGVMFAFYCMYGRHNSVAKRKIEARRSGLTPSTSPSTRTPVPRSPATKMPPPFNNNAGAATIATPARTPTTILSRVISFGDVGAQMPEDNPDDDYTDLDSEEEAANEEFGIQGAHHAMSGSHSPKKKKQQQVKREAGKKKFSPAGADQPVEGIIISRATATAAAASAADSNAPKPTNSIMKGEERRQSDAAGAEEMLPTDGSPA